MNYVGIWLYRLLIAALLAICIAYSFHEEWSYEQQVALTGYTGRNNEKRTTVILISPWLLPLIFVVPCLTMLLLLGPVVSAITLVQFSFQLIVVLTLYFGVLLAVLPLLRRRISARACATLWLLPVFFYYVIGLSDKIYLPPLVVLRIPPNAAPLLVQIWLIGAAAVVVWHILSHVWFRRRILKDARPVKEEAVMDLWWTEQRQALLKWHIRLVTSPAVSSPLTIGLFNKTMVTVLPEHAYTLEQYRLIFRHELRHVQRRDVDTKCFYLFCKALCWFNPLMWVALRKASADLELSCDEMVVYGAEDKTRRRGQPGIFHLPVCLGQQPAPPAPGGGCTQGACPRYQTAGGGHGGAGAVLRHCGGKRHLWHPGGCGSGPLWADSHGKFHHSHGGQHPILSG